MLLRICVWIVQLRHTAFIAYHPLHHSFARECDGFLSISSAAYDQKALEAVRAWLRETNRPVYAIGPLIPPGFGDNQLSDTAKQMEIDSSANGREFQAFLDKTLTTHGKHSLIFVSHTRTGNSMGGWLMFPNVPRSPLEAFGGPRRMSTFGYL
jgi:hypothetical protein